MSTPSREEHFDRLLRWLDMEAAAEAEERRAKLTRTSPTEAERLGGTLVDMAVDDETVGLGGRRLWSLCKRNRTLALPWTRLRVGSPVLLTNGDADAKAERGVVSRRDDRSITIALASDSDELDSDGTWRIDASSDETARQRQRTAMQTLRRAQHGRAWQWTELLLGRREPRFHTEAAAEPFDTSLNEAQREAVRFALSADDLAIIHGPPGTGKTTTLVELVRRSVARGEKVLVCAGSNLAVDNLLERLTVAGIRTLRLGHPARVLPEVRNRTLDYLVDAHADMRVAEDLRREAGILFRRAARFTRARPAAGERGAQRAEARQMINDARKMERRLEHHLLDESDAICATLTGLDDNVLDDREFDLVVVDEAAQATEPPCWIPLVRTRKLVLAGDHCQLPPTIVSTEAARQGFSVSLMERLMQVGAGRWSRLLNVQYRMHADIMEFSSDQFYEGRLQAADDVAAHVLAELPGVIDDAATRAPLEFIDTAGAEFDESPVPGGESRFNRREAALVCSKVKALLAAGIRPTDVAVITPYAAQVRLIGEMLDMPEVEVDSVDGFQGREKEAVVVSLVRSNGDGEIGFLADTRRMNVALTRARRKLLVVGDGALLGGHPFYKALLDYVEQRGGYHSVWEEPLDE